MNQTTMSETELLIEYAKCWNNLDVSFIMELLDDDLEYTSQWVLETMYGKNTYLKYLSGKFTSIRNGKGSPKAELGYYKYAPLGEKKPCLVLAQDDVKVAILAEAKNGKLSKINMVGIPSPNNAILFDFVPK